jgi:HSP20 family protein
MRTTRYSILQSPGWPLFDQLDSLQDEIQRIFNRTEQSRQSELFNGWAPALDLYENSEDLVVQAELPGMRREEIEVSLHQGSLIISGERKAEQQHDQITLTRAERPVGRFQRSLRLPKPVEAGKVSAVYRDGILTVTLPKTEESRPRQVQIKTQ